MLTAKKQTAITKTARIPTFRKCLTNSPREITPGAEFEIDSYDPKADALCPDFPSGEPRWAKLYTDPETPGQFFLRDRGLLSSQLRKSRSPRSCYHFESQRRDNNALSWASEAA
jgi:hypothetical protein